MAQNAGGGWPRPGVIILHEAFGLGDHVQDRARRLAHSGYAALAADLFGGRAVPKDREEATRMAQELVDDPAELAGRIDAACDALRRQPLVDDTRLAVIGYCFGGTAALEYGRAGGSIAGVACFHGRLTTASPLSRSRSAPRFLVCTGAEDPLVPPAHIEAFTAEMREAEADWQLHLYGRAGHGFTDPSCDALGIPGVGYHQPTDRRSWQALEDYLQDLFGGEEPSGAKDS